MAYTGKAVSCCMVSCLIAGMIGWLFPLRPRRALMLVCVLLAFGGCVEPARTMEWTSRPVPLDRDRPDLDRIGAFTFRGAVELLGSSAGVGGLSGLAVIDGGRRLVAVSDIGRLATGRLHHEGGRLVGVTGGAMRPLPGMPPRPGAADHTDSEEIVALPDGGWLVALEGRHRIEHYAAGPGGPEGEPEEIPVPPGLERFPANSGLEALTRLHDGRLLAIAEGPDDGRAERQAWIGRFPIKRARDWQGLTYRAERGFRAVGATVLPDGDVLVLERRFSFLRGFGMRIARVRAADLMPGATVEGQELARLELPLLTDNFEGIAAVPGAGGEALVYLVSDDNFHPLQRTYLVMLALPDEKSAQARR